ncbi:MAG: chorismate synthase [Gemmatimonadota bacterium]|nr:chorismate synthase [Gemmatimonadota bacterium]MDH5195780.1 chorismate synthase [Gemmatimonadota bacterium]
MRFTTAGESHGQALLAILEGVPAGLPLRAAHVDADLRRRMMGHGRGARMKIEADQVEILSGVRAGETLGSPIALLIRNRDWEHWQDVMAVEPDPPKAAPRRRAVHRPRPGHADLVGALKYDRTDARDILERASARETAARVACGAVCRVLLACFDVEIGSHVIRIGDVEAPSPDGLPVPLNAVADASPVRCLDATAAGAMVAAIDAAKRDRDTLGGVVEVVVRGLPVGLGSHVSWDRKLDGRLAQALMSIPAVKGVAVGLGFGTAALRGSQVHDAIVQGVGPAAGGFLRTTNRAGGLEGGMTTGAPLVLRVAMKPISTLMRPLQTVDLATGKASKAQAERADVTAVPALGVIAEAMTALVLADAVTEKFGGDALADVRAGYEQYVTRLRARTKGSGDA